MNNNKILTDAEFQKTVIRLTASSKQSNIDGNHICAYFRIRFDFRKGLAACLNDKCPQSAHGRPLIEANCK